MSTTPKTEDAAAALGDAIVKIYQEWKSSDAKAQKISNTSVIALNDAFKIFNDATGVLSEAKTNPSDFAVAWVQASVPVIQAFFSK